MVRSNIAISRGAGFIFTALLVLVLSTPTASSQGIFDSLLGAFKRPVPHASPQVASFADPLQLSRPLSLFGTPMENTGARDAGGPWSAYCVRLCDGRYFPLPRSSAMSPAEQCRSFCPAAKTKVLGGTSINNAAAADGTRYATLENAFVYRKRIVENCTCNGRDAFGVARMDLAADPTLRPGDIVAINDGFATYTGAKSKRASDFTPIAQYSGLSYELRQKLSQTKVMPVRSPVAQSSAAANDKIDDKFTRRDDRRAQLSR